MKHNLKLSEAIREGAKLHPQGFGALFRMHAGNVCTCALGAAYEALKGDAADYEVYGVQGYNTIADRIMHELTAAWDDLTDGLYYIEDGKPRLMTESEHLQNPLSGHDLRSLIVELNDALEWPREQIADWLETEGY